MTPEEIAKKFAEIEAREKSNTKRLDKLESDHDVLICLAHSVEAMTHKLDDVDKKLDALDSLPTKRWRTFIGYLLAAAASSLATFVGSRWGG